jgi:integrase
VNKLIGGVQATLIWAHDKGGFIPDDVPWADPFARMRLEEDEPDREPFEIAELRVLFSSPVFTKKDLPKAGRGEAAYWLPLLALFAGGRRGELASLRVADVQRETTNGDAMITITEDRNAGKSLKTRNSQRAIPIHTELRKLGFLDYLEKVRREHGEKAWLFPLVAPEKPGGAAAWTKWFGRHLRSLGIRNTKVFHSLRHNFVDAMRAAGVDEELRVALAGHGWRRTTTNRGYGAKDMVRRFTAKALIRAVGRIAYPGLDLSHLRASRRSARKSPNSLSTARAPLG